MKIFYLSIRTVASCLALTVALATALGNSPARADLPKPPRKVTVVIFTASYGGGHNSSANATRELIETRAAAEGIDVEVIIKDTRNYLPGAALPGTPGYDERREPRTPLIANFRLDLYQYAIRL